MAISSTKSASSGSSNGNGEFTEPIVREERRNKLPTPAPFGNEVPSLWGILRKNIGKDLSRISMPVTLNEPLGVLQRMCEELEYSELLDNACTSLINWIFIVNYIIELL
jgi:hypothetical protein